MRGTIVFGLGVPYAMPARKNRSGPAFLRFAFA